MISIPAHRESARLSKFIAARRLRQGSFQAWFAQPPEQSLESDTHFGSREMRSETGMCPRRKSQMAPTIFAIQIESAGIREDRRIAIGGAQHAIHRVVRRELDSSPFKRCNDVASGRLHGAQPTHCFLNETWH